MYSLARRITAGAPTSYAAVLAVDRYLQRHYGYGEHPARHDFPLEAFLFQDRFGYCQQFSGAMALMLRMVGIPARAAAGFTPGTLNRYSHEWRVRDLDAHSWVEVYFNGIGWVRFDPTPSSAPAASQSSGPDPPAPAGAGAAPPPPRLAGHATPRRPPHPRAARPAGAGPGWWLLALATGALLTVLAAAMWLVRAVAARGRTAQELDEARVAELRAALERLGFTVPPETTLLVLERRLRRLGGAAAARYAAVLRAARFSPQGAPAPVPADRRALRQALTARRGPLARLRGLLALPPAPFSRA
jgi:transglutaminase-like putative cysteine protease